jgi:predicted metal-dependent enzyme (double-stranded beta helix superfamily)
MAYTLEEFCNASRSALKASDNSSIALAAIADDLKKLLVDRDFVAETFAEPAAGGKRVLFHDPEMDFYVQAHWQQPGKGGTPHSHGASWAVYGNAKGFTEMTEWRRVNPESEEQVVLEASDLYRLGPGQSRAYGPGVIHSTAHPEAAWVIRVTGTDLDSIPRYHFRAKRDKILEKA